MMRTLFTLAAIVFCSAGASAQDLEFRVVDANTGKRIAEAKCIRKASQWQPRILALPAKFWFPAESVQTNADGIAIFTKHATDDHYKISAIGYVAGYIERVGKSYRFQQIEGGKPFELKLDKSGIWIVPLQKVSLKPAELPDRQ